MKLFKSVGSDQSVGLALVVGFLLSIMMFASGNAQTEYGNLKRDKQEIPNRGETKLGNLKPKKPETPNRGEAKLGNLKPEKPETPNRGESKLGASQSAMQQRQQQMNQQTTPQGMGLSKSR